MTLITLENLKQQLTLAGIPIDYTDEQLQLLLTNTINELTGSTNLPLQATNHKTIINNFNDKIVELDHYPVKEISSLKIGGSELSTDDYVLDNSLGILYFDSVLNGLLTCSYVSQVDDDVVDNKVNPLIVDIIRYRISSNFSVDGVTSSVKEGDVSVNYDTSSSLGNLILSRINDLKNSYSIRIKMV